MTEYVTRPRRFNDIWLTEYSTENLTLSMKVKKFIHAEKTKYQELLIADTYDYGRVLMLDGAYQLTEVDEFCYSEMMSHVPLCAHENPEKVLIIGGGDGAIMREVFKHDCVKKCTLVDIDQRVADCSKEFLPFAGKSFEDPRCDFKCMDAMKFIHETSERYDVVIVDSTDPVDFAAGLFRADFYDDVKKIMKPGAILSELTMSPFTDKDIMQQSIKEMRKIFPAVKLYWGVVPTYPSGFWTYGVAMNNPEMNPALPVRKVNGTRYYTSEIHKSAFVLPPFLEEMINR